MKRTFLDAGVLIAAATGRGSLSERAMKILGDPDREFVVSPFLQLEVLPKAIYNKRQREAEFYRQYFAGAQYRTTDAEQLMLAAHTMAAELGLSAMDALHLAAASQANCDELVTTEKPGAPIYRCRSVKVVFLESVKP